MVNAQFTSYTRMERIKSSAVSVSMEYTSKTFCFKTAASYFTNIVA